MTGETHTTEVGAARAGVSAHANRLLRALHSDGPGREQWLGLLSSSSEPEVFAHPGYLDLYRQDADRACCLVYTSGSRSILYPVLLRDVGGTGFWQGDPLFDAGPPPFGYAGPFVEAPVDETDRQALLTEFYEHYRRWALEQGVVAEYTLFSPFVDVPAAYPGDVTVRIPVVVRSLEMSEEEIWYDYRSQVRRNVRTAVRNGVTVTIDEEGKYADEFLDVHMQTMHRRNAEDSHRLSPDFLDRLHRELSGGYAYVHAWQDGRIISSDLMLVSAASTFYFRGGTLADKLDTRANQLVKHECILWARRTGKRAVLLGGGVEGEDALFRYKASFAPHGVRHLYSGKWVVDPHRYQQLMEARRAHDRERGRRAPAGGEDGGFFPAYRAPSR